MLTAETLAFRQQKRISLCTVLGHQACSERFIGWQSLLNGFRAGFCCNVAKEAPKYTQYSKKANESWEKPHKNKPTPITNNALARYLSDERFVFLAIILYNWIISKNQKTSQSNSPMKPVSANNLA